MGGQRFLVVIAAIAFVILTYQNCAPPSGSGNLNLGGSGNQASTSVQTGSVTLSAIAIPQANVQPGATLTASVTLTNSSSGTCSWTVYDTSHNLISQLTTTTTNGICSYSAVAPNTAGTYTLTIFASSPKLSGTAVSQNFVVSASAPPPPASTPGPTPVPSPVSTCLVSGYNCYTSSYNDGQIGLCGQCCNGYHADNLYQYQYNYYGTVNYYCN